MTREQIIHQAMLLGQAIADSDEMGNLKKAQQEVTSDPVSYQIILRYQQARAGADSKLQQGLALTGEEERELDDLEKQIRENAKVQALIDSQESFDNLMQSVYFMMNQTISGPSCGGSCAGCGGGCS